MMRRVYEPESLLEAELLISMLGSEGIAAHLSGRHLVGGVGELPALGLLALLIEDAQAERARALIDAYNAAFVLPADAPDSYPGSLLC